MLPKLTSTILRLGQQVKLIRTISEIVNHRPVETETFFTIKAVIQPAQHSKLNKSRLDFNLKYIQVHSIDEIKINDIIEYKNKRYRVFEEANYIDYGYYETILEEIK